MTNGRAEKRGDLMNTSDFPRRGQNMTRLETFSDAAIAFAAAPAVFSLLFLVGPLMSIVQTRLARERFGGQ